MKRKSVAAYILPFFCIIIILAGIGCSSGGSGGDSSEASWTTDEVNQLMDSLTDAADSSGAFSSPDADVRVEEAGTKAVDNGAGNCATALKGATFTNTCSTSHYQSAAVVSDSMACPAGGHITWSGNVNIYCNQWMYHNATQYVPEYCECTGEWRTGTMITFQYGDRTNNLNDCDTGGVIVDGTVTFTMTGPADAPDFQYVGVLTANRKGSTGGLRPLKSCIVNFGYWGASKTWHGTICGSTVH